MTNHSETGSTQEPEKGLFANIVMMLATSALQYMGRLNDPNAPPQTVNLEAAQTMIDMLDALERKTQGNLDAEEKKMLGDTLHALKLNFVEAKKGTPARDRPPQAGAPSAAQAPPEGQRPGTIETDKPRQDEEKKPKFHKKYD